MISTTILTQIPLDPTIPDIQPDFSAPFFVGIKMVASWILAAGLLFAFIALILAIAMLAIKGLAGPQMKAIAAVALPWALAGLVILSAATGIFTWLIGLDFGFGTTFGGQA